MRKRTLRLHDLHLRHLGVSQGISIAYSEAASVCLSRHHASPIDMVVERQLSNVMSASWVPPTAALQAAWANETDTTEAGAYCVALAAVEECDGLLAISRAETKSGADYYLAPDGGEADDLESTRRLEVSGMNFGTEAKLRQRLAQKLQQAKSGKSNTPAIAAVVCFETKTVLIDDVK